MWSPRGLDLIEVCARWCPTLPHPGGCSTIGAVRLSFRVRDGYRAFPCRCDHRDDYMGSAGPSSLVRLFGYRAALQRTLCVVGGWVGCGPYSGRSRSYLFHSPPGLHAVCVCCVGVVVVCVGLLVPVSSQTVTGLPLLAYQPSSLLGAYQERASPSCGDLILKMVSRLDAFSGYPSRT